MRTKHITVIAAVLALTSLLIGTVAAKVTDSPAPAPGEIVRFCPSNVPDGPCVLSYPKGAKDIYVVPVGTDAVYAVLEYAYMDGEQYKIIVYDPFGATLLNQTTSFTGSGTKSFEVRYYKDGEQVAFPVGTYVTNLYSGGLLTKDFWWEVTEAVGVATPTPQATATPTMVPTATPTYTPTAIPTDTPTVAPRATPTAPPTEVLYPMPEATATPTGTPIATPEAMETLPPTATTAPIAPMATSTPTPAMATPAPVMPTVTAVSPMPLTATATPRPIPAPSPAPGLSRLSANAFLYVVIGFTALLALLALGMWRK